MYVTEAERDIIDSHPVQRLRRLKQLAGSEFVYPAANHTRFEHSIGVMHLAGRALENFNVSRLVSKDEAEAVRIAALLHDVGHGPFSHVFEHLLIKSLEKTHEDMTSWVIQRSELSDVLKGLGYDPSEISKLAVGTLNKPGRAFLDQIVRSSVDVDKLDFIVRDTYHTGAEYGYVDVPRIINSFDVLNGELSVDIGALSALESFMIARVESFKSIYFHRVSRAAQIMMVLAMEKAEDELGLLKFKTPEEYLALDDFTVWIMLKKCERSKSIVEGLERRKLLKCAYERIFYVRDDSISRIFEVEEVRDQLRSEIAKKADVKEEVVIIDVPTLPSVPYRHSLLMEPMEVPVFFKRGGRKVVRNLSEISSIFNVLRGFINILRVYTEARFREKVEAAATKVLGEAPISTRISY